MTPITDYAAREDAINRYINWLRRCEASLADRPTPDLSPVERDPSPRRRTSRSDALASL